VGWEYSRYVACPTCGGTSRDQIAPNYWRCSTVLVTETGGPGLTDPRLGPPVIRHERVCSVEYQDGGVLSASAPTCECGTFAVGRCQGCGTMVCGSHSSLYEDERVCDGCREAREIVVQRAATEAAEAERAAVAEAKARAVEQGAERARYVGSLPSFPGEAIVAFLRGELRSSGPGVVVFEGQEYALRKVRSIDVAAAVATVGLPGPFKHTLRRFRPGGAGKAFKVRGWVFAEVTRESDPDKVGDWIRSDGFVLTVAGEVGYFSSRGDHGGGGSHAISEPCHVRVAEMSTDDLIPIRDAL